MKRMRQIPRLANSEKLRTVAEFKPSEPNQRNQPEEEEYTTTSRD